MLCELYVENLLLIERARLRLAPGLNVITGETGAGKSVLAHAFDLLLGGRARSGIVRPGAGEAYVEGVFELAASEEIVLARRVEADGGRTRAFVNGRSATVAELRDLGARLLSFYGQHEHRKLTVAGAQLRILDEVCGPGQRARLGACERAYRQSAELQAELERLRELAGARERELDLLAHELAEIDDAIVEQSEYERLLGARERLGRLDALCSAAGYAANALACDSDEQMGASTLLAAATARLQDATGVDTALDSLCERLRAVTVETQELAGELRNYGEELGGEDGSLEDVEERLAGAERLLRKYGGSIPEVLAYAGRARARHSELDGVEVELSRTKERLDGARAELQRVASELHEARTQAALRLAQAVRAQLAALAMGEAEFEVARGERPLGADGGDIVEMMLTPNPGVPAGSLREIASGGELSRVMLAVIAASAEGAAGVRTDQDEQTTLVFDEIDAGIGGHTARAVGERLQTLGESRQVLCITHLPQIASLGARHFSIVKDTSAEPARTAVVQLDEPDVVSELVRMLGAHESDRAARRHASDLRKAA
jgi:DNA repair protein RecN (Recombination protein N)